MRGRSCSSSDSRPCKGTRCRCSAGHSCRSRLRRRRRARRRTQLLLTSTYRRPSHSVVQAQPSMPDRRFLFLLKSFEWLHRWHGHNEARRVVDCSDGIILREGKREGDWTSRGRFGWKFRGEDTTIPIRGVILIYLRRNLQYRIEISLPRPLPSCRVTTGHGIPFHCPSCCFGDRPCLRRVYKGRITTKRWRGGADSTIKSR